MGAPPQLPEKSLGEGRTPSPTLFLNTGIVFLGDETARDTLQAVQQGGNGDFRRVVD